MLTPLPLAIGLRYTRAKRRTRFISFISASSLLGIALGVTALITVLSVMNGFEGELRGRILGMIAHATVTSSARGLDHWQELASQLAIQPHVQDSAPYVEAQGMLAQGSLVNGVVLRGVLPDQESRVSQLAHKVVEGRFTDLQPGQFNLCLGQDLANHFGLLLGDKVAVVTPQATVTPAGLLPRLKRFTLVCVFSVGMYEYDSGLAVTHLEDAARLFRLPPGEVTGMRLVVDDLYQAPLISRELAKTLPGSYQVKDWTESHTSFFQAIRTEKTVMFIILTLIVAVAAFNIVASLVMVVTDKEADIAILRTLGMSPRNIMAIFVIQGTVIGAVGTLLGLIAGVELALHLETVVPALEQWLGIRLLPADVYYITRLPSDLRWPDVIRIGGIAFLLSVLATLYPAWRAARLQPAATLRYE